jgi:hypothetical protein
MLRKVVSFTQTERYGKIVKSVGEGRMSAAYEFHTHGVS